MHEALVVVSARYLAFAEILMADEVHAIRLADTLRVQAHLLPLPASEREGGVTNSHANTGTLFQSLTAVGP